MNLELMCYGFHIIRHAEDRTERMAGLTMILVTRATGSGVADHAAAFRN